MITVNTKILFYDGDDCILSTHVECLQYNLWTERCKIDLGLIFIKDRRLNSSLFRETLEIIEFVHWTGI